MTAAQSEIKLSVCVPTRNRPQMVTELVGSLVAAVPQDLRCEILVGDNSTTPETEQLLSDHPSGLVRYFRNAPVGLGQFDNVNALVARARGEWIHVVHDDDTLDERYFEAIARYLDEPGVALIMGRSQMVGAGADAFGREHQARLDRMGLDKAGRHGGRDVITACLQEGCPFVFSHTLFRREDAIRYGGFDVRLHRAGDYEMWLRLMDAGDVLVVDEVFGRYLLHESNYSWAPQSSFELRVERLHMALRYGMRYADWLAPAVLRDLLDRTQRDLARGAFTAQVLLERPTLAGLLDETLRSASRFFDGSSPRRPRLRYSKALYGLLRCLPVGPARAAWRASKSVRQLRRPRPQFQG